MAGAMFIIVGVILRWDLIDWLIDATGFILIMIGAVMGVIGLITMFSGGGKKSYGDF
jgi:hypothetical protein|tara:strand:- start:523 stop:693 length:171 start_codon:yes stop_codon:yes gene_type:complete